VGRLAPGQLSAVRGLLEAMLDPIDRSIAAALVEEQEIAPQTAKELDRAKGSIDDGRGITHDEILRGFGVTPRAAAACLNELRRCFAAPILIN
jgi:hypothetical protein